MEQEELAGRKRLRDEPGRRHSSRKPGARVLFSEVMAQEREMERLNHEKRLPRKGEAEAQPAQRKKQKRAEERRSKRQALRRTMSPRSPDGGPVPLRGGVKLAILDEPKKRFARDEDAIQDASLHSTAWRGLRFAKAPVNLLPTRDGMKEPYALELDRPLDAFDEELKSKCKLQQFLGLKPLTAASGTLGEAKERAQIDDKVRELIDEATPLAKKAHAARANVVIANMRQQVTAYLEDIPRVRAEATKLTALPLCISRLEKVAARRLLRNGEFAPEGEEKPHYSAGRTETEHSEWFYPESVTYFSTIAPIPRSTTCMLSRGTHRVEDDPIIRFVPYFSLGSNAKSQAPEFTGVGPSKATLLGFDDEVNEFVLRYVINACGGDQDVFEALQRCGSFPQPFANYADIVTRDTREQLHDQHVEELKALENSSDTTMQARRAISELIHECEATRAGLHLRGRLRPLPTQVTLNYLQEARSMGIRDPPSRQYRDLAQKFQEFFCRRCCSYSCRNHGREQPMPAIRVDPNYPVVKATTRLWRRIENEEMADDRINELVEDADDPMNDESGEHTPEEAELVLEQAPQPDELQSDRVCSSSGAVMDDERTRRSVRAVTAANTKASLVHRHLGRKKHVRPKTADASEYLGLDPVYDALTQGKREQLLAQDARCGAHCSKPIADSEQQSDDALEERRPWANSEIALLNKLELCVGHNPCLISAMLAARSCSEVAEYLWQRESEVKSGFNSRDLLRHGAYGRNRERTNGVLGNGHEHLRRTRFQRMKDRGANHEFVPCNHSGSSCDSAQCSCMRRDHYCEKACGCAPDCSNRFPGCHCEAGQCRTMACPCYFASRECDPDKCISCGASELPVIMADESSKYKTCAQLKICGNVNIMRGQLRKIGVAASNTHGWGAYALENVKKGEFMYEYTGSLLSQDEAERRGNVYDKATVSFLFDLNEDSVVDATRKGNKSKFANHDSTDPKCFARIMLVNGDHRIGIYAKKDIVAGDELFFDYGYSGVVPDWSQARIGSGKNVPSIEEDSDNANGAGSSAAHATSLVDGASSVDTASSVESASPVNPSTPVDTSSPVDVADNVNPESKPGSAE